MRRRCGRRDPLRNSKLAAGYAGICGESAQYSATGSHIGDELGSEGGSRYRERKLFKALGNMREI